jgi:hypothetical protein
MSSLYRFLPLIALTVVFVPTASSGQNAGGVQSTHKAELSSKRHTSLDRARTRQVAVELERQQAFLRGVTSRFEAVAIHDFTPLLQYSYVWTALRDNRVRMAKQARTLTSEQSKLIIYGYDALEKEVVASFGDYQLSILNEVLELNEMQMEEVQKAVEDDLNSRRVLLKSRDIGIAQFTSRVNAISKKTETRILEILFPEQRKRFERELNFTRDRLVG